MSHTIFSFCHALTKVTSIEETNRPTPLVPLHLQPQVQLILLLSCNPQSPRKTVSGTIHYLQFNTTVLPSTLDLRLMLQSRMPQPMREQEETEDQGLE